MADPERRALNLEDYVAMDGPEGTVVLVPRALFAADTAPVPRAVRSRRSNDDKDESLREMLARAKPLLAAKYDWCDSDKPYTSLLSDCQELAAQPAIADGVRSYLTERPAVRDAANMLVTAISMSANSDWRLAPEVVRSVAARGWFLNRWLPTFLIIDGPIVRFMAGSVWKGQRRRAEAFIAARNLLSDKVFVSVRNAFAHWSFGWETIEREHWIVVYDERTAVEKMRFHQRQGDALHMIAWSIVDVLNQVFFRPVDAG